MTDRPYVYVWSLQVRPERVEEFERAYGPDGDWVALFRRGAGYRSTQLLGDHDRPGWYLTIDTWDSAEAFDAFRSAHSAEFEALDRQCEQFTLSEALVGRFRCITPGEEAGEPPGA